MARSCLCLCLCLGLAMGPGVHSSLKFMFTPAGLGSRVRVGHHPAPSPSGAPSLELSQPAVSAIAIANARWVVCGCACGFSYGSVSFICTADNTMHEMWKIYCNILYRKYSTVYRVCNYISYAFADRFIRSAFVSFGGNTHFAGSTTAANENIYQLI